MPSTPLRASEIKEFHGNIWPPHLHNRIPKNVQDKMADLACVDPYVCGCVYCIAYQTQPPHPVSRYWVLFAVAYLDLGVACGRATLILSFSFLSLSLASCPLPTFTCHGNNRLQPPLILVAFSFFYGAPTWYPGTLDGKFLKSIVFISHIHLEKKAHRKHL